MRTAEIELERRTIAAPFAGVTGLTDLSLGDLVSSTTPVTTLDDLSTIRVEFEVPERWAGRVAQGQAIERDRPGAAGLRTLREHRRHRQPHRRGDPHAAPGSGARE